MGTVLQLEEAGGSEEEGGTESIGEVSLPSDMINRSCDAESDHGKRQETMSTESPSENLRYPFQVFFIIGNEFCERFCYYGLRTIQVLYLSQQLGLSQSTSDVIYHGFTTVAYFTPLLGAILADSLLGRFRTIFYLSIVYAVGSIILSVAAIEVSNYTLQASLSYCGLALIALGTGGIKPCVSSLGGDQFVIPGQEKQLKQFFSVFYFAINAGSLISTFLTPELRAGVHCLGQDTCYPLAFGVPAILMILSLVLFLLGSRLYTKVPPEGAVLVSVVKCIGHALANKWRRVGVKKDHFLLYASDLYDSKFIGEVRTVLSILLLFIPLPVFWALYDQQGSRWTFQASRLDGNLGSFTLYPDQMAFVNPVLILTFIPIFELGVYPLLARCNLLTKALSRMTLGGFLAVAAFITSGFLSRLVESREPVLPSVGTGDVFIFNESPCILNVRTKWTNVDNSFIVNPSDMISIKGIYTNGSKQTDYGVEWIPSKCQAKSSNGSITVYNEEVHSVIVAARNTSLLAVENETPDDITKGPTTKHIGYPWVRIMYDAGSDSSVNATFLLESVHNSYQLNASSSSGAGFSDIQDVNPGGGSYKVSMVTDGKELKASGSVSFKLGGSYMLYVNVLEDHLEVFPYVLTYPNNITILAMLPQYVIITAAEILFSISGLEFSFSQAPLSMKSVMAAAWLLTVSFGDLIDVIVIESLTSTKQSTLTFIFAIFMAADVAIFAFLSRLYTYVDTDGEDKGRDSRHSSEQTVPPEDDEDLAIYH